MYQRLLLTLSAAVLVAALPVYAQTPRPVPPASQAQAGCAAEVKRAQN